MRSLLLYGHPLFVDHLSKNPLAPKAHQWAEIAVQTVLGHRLGLPQGPGVESLLGGGTPEERTADGISVQLASNTRVAAPAVTAGALMLPPEVGWLMHVSSVTELAELLPHADHIALWWDLADPPTAALGALSETLVREASRGAWRGLHLYRHPERADYEPEERRAVWSGWLQQPDLVSA